MWLGNVCCKNSSFCIGFLLHLLFLKLLDYNLIFLCLTRSFAWVVVFAVGMINIFFGSLKKIITIITKNKQLLIKIRCQFIWFVVSSTSYFHYHNKNILKIIKTYTKWLSAFYLFLYGAHITYFFNMLLKWNQDSTT